MSVLYDYKSEVRSVFVSAFLENRRYMKSIIIIMHGLALLQRLVNMCDDRVRSELICILQGI